MWKKFISQPLNLGAKEKILLEVTYQQKYQSANRKELSLASSDFCNNYRQEGVMAEERISTYPQQTTQRGFLCLDAPDPPQNTLCSYFFSHKSCQVPLFVVTFFSITASQNAIELASATSSWLSTAHSLEPRTKPLVATCQIHNHFSLKIMQRRHKI